MIYIFGGAYQGKLDFAKEKFNIEDSDICDVSKENLDFSKKVIYHFEKLIREDFSVKENITKLLDKIIIADDESCGLVPISEEDRLYRENAGRALTFISESSSEVYRVFMGIGLRLK